MTIIDKRSGCNLGTNYFPLLEIVNPLTSANDAAAIRKWEKSKGFTHADELVKSSTPRKNKGGNLGGSPRVGGYSACGTCGKQIYTQRYRLNKGTSITGKYCKECYLQLTSAKAEARRKTESKSREEDKLDMTNYVTAQGILCPRCTSASIARNHDSLTCVSCGYELTYSDLLSLTKSIVNIPDRSILLDIGNPNTISVTPAISTPEYVKKVETKEQPDIRLSESPYISSNTPFGQYRKKKAKRKGRVSVPDSGWEARTKSMILRIDEQIDNEYRRYRSRISQLLYEKHTYEVALYNHTPIHDEQDISNLGNSISSQ